MVQKYFELLQLELDGAPVRLKFCVVIISKLTFTFCGGSVDGRRTQKTVELSKGELYIYWRALQTVEEAWLVARWLWGESWI